MLRRHRRRLIAATALAVLSVGGALLVQSPAAFAATMAVDVTVNTHQSAAASTLTSGAVTTHQTNELLVAFVTSDGPSGGGQSFSSVTGGGLTWTRRTAANLQPGAAEIWQAGAANILTNVTVTATRSSGSYGGSLTIVAFSGADLTAQGATSANSAASGAPTTSLTTRFANSWVWGVGNDWSTATARTVGPNQTLVDQYLSPAGDTYWTQRQNATTASAGTPATINDTAPTGDRFDIAEIEIVPAGGTATPPPAAPTGLTANVANAGEVDLAWTASTSTGVDHYDVTRDGAATGRCW